MCVTVYMTKADMMAFLFTFIFIFLFFDCYGSFKVPIGLFGQMTQNIRLS